MESEDLDRTSVVQVTLFTRSLRMENVTLFSTSAHLIASALRSGKDRNSESAFAHFAISRLRNYCTNCAVCLYVLPEILALSHHTIVL